MGCIRAAQGRFPEARKYHERAITNIKATLGEKHYFAGDCFYSLAVVLIRLDDLLGAR